MSGPVIVHPVYTYHPPGVEPQDLYDGGAMLATVQQSMPPGRTFILAEHSQKTGSQDLDLNSIAQTGMAQWADSWILQSHASPARVDEGLFAIAVGYGSRQYVVEWSLGVFN